MVTRKTQRGARSDDTDNLDSLDENPDSCVVLNRGARSHTMDSTHNSDSCLVLMSWDPFGLSGGSSQATACERELGIYDDGLQNVQSPYEYALGFVNTCEEYCLKRPDCDFYLFDCKLSLCTLKMGDITGHQLLNYTRYITGKKNNRAAKECQKDIIPGSTPRPAPRPTTRPTQRPTLGPTPGPSPRPRPTPRPTSGPSPGTTPGTTPGTGQGTSFSHHD